RASSTLRMRASSTLRLQAFSTLRRRASSPLRLRASSTLRLRAVGCIPGFIPAGLLSLVFFPIRGGRLGGGGEDEPGHALCGEILSGDAADVLGRDLAVAFEFGVVARRVAEQDGAAAERIG